MSSMTCACVCVQTLDSQYTKSSLPRSAKYLKPGVVQETLGELVCGEHWLATSAKYLCMVDFLLCEIFINFREGCFAFYEGKGKHLCESYTKQQLVHIDNQLFKMMRALWAQNKSRKR